MSVVLKLNIEASKSVLITTAASVAVCRAIKNITGKDTGIKWVNDIYYKDRKICGILTEAVTDCETGTIDSIVLGIGINYNVPEEAVPKELRGIVGAIYNRNCNIPRNRMIAEVLNNVFELCQTLPDNSFIEEYKRYSIIIGKEIYILEQDGCTEAAALDIDSNGGLIVKMKDNTFRTLNTGEITIRRKLT